MPSFKELLIKRLGYFPIFSGIIVLICGIYCMTCWEPVYPLTYYQPDIGITCWLYCSTMNHWIGIINLLIAALSVTGGILLIINKTRTGSYLSIISGIATLPIGILGIFAGWYSLKTLKK